MTRFRRPHARGERWAIAQFTLSGLAAVVLVLVLVLVAFNRAGRAAAISNAEEVTRIATSGVLEPALDVEMLRGDRAAVARLDERVRASLLREPVLRVSILRRDGSVVYSTDPAHPRRPLDANQRAALETGETRTRTGGPRAPGADVPASVQLLDVYQSVRAEDGELLLVETCRRLTSVSADSRALLDHFGPYLVGGVLALQLINLPLAIALVRRVRRARRHDELLLQREVAASDRERRRLASDLHNGVIQELAGLSMALSASQRSAAARGDGEAAERLEQIAAGGRRTTRTLRQMLVDIYPPNLQRAGLRSALEDLAERARRRGLVVTVAVDESFDGLAPDVAAIVYRVTDEAVRNAVGHARAVRLELRVQREPDGSVRMLVADDGRGFAPEHVADGNGDGHLGLSLMRDLIEQGGGELAVESAPGDGTRVQASLPAP